MKWYTLVAMASSLWIIPMGVDLLLPKILFVIAQLLCLAQVIIDYKKGY